MCLLRRVFLLFALLFMLIAAPVLAQDGLHIIDAGDVTGFFENSKGTAQATIYINNETDLQVNGTLNLTVLIKAASPANDETSPICVSINALPCANPLEAQISLPPRTVYSLIITLETAANSPLQYVEGTLITQFNQSTTPVGEEPTPAEPLTFTDYRKLFVVPSLYVPNTLRDAGIATGIFLALALLAQIILNNHSIFKDGVWDGFWRPLAELTWGAQSWTAFLTSLASTIGVFALSGSSAGISLTTFNAGVYTTTVTTVGIIFAVLPAAAVIVYRLLGRLSKSDPKGGNLVGYMIGSACILFALIGSVLLSSNVILMLIHSSFGVSTPDALPTYLNLLTYGRLAILAIIILYFIANFRIDLSSQLKSQEAQLLQDAKEDVLIRKFEAAWTTNDAAASAALLALQALKDYDLPIAVPAARLTRRKPLRPETIEIIRSAVPLEPTQTPVERQEAPARRSRASATPKMSI